MVSQHQITTTYLEKQSQLVRSEGDVHEALFLDDGFCFGADAVLECHQRLVVLLAFFHTLLIMSLRILVSLATSQTVRNNMFDPQFTINVSILTRLGGERPRRRKATWYS